MQIARAAEAAGDFPLKSFTYFHRFEAQGEMSEILTCCSPRGVVVMPPGRRLGRMFRFVQLEVQRNWGNPHYTCIYRVRVHGKRKREP